MKWAVEGKWPSWQVRAHLSFAPKSVTQIDSVSMFKMQMCHLEGLYSLCFQNGCCLQKKDTKGGVSFDANF